MTLPTGGQVAYGYTNTTTPNLVNRWVTSRTVDGNTWTFIPALLCTTASCTAPGDGQTVTVTTPPYSDGSSTASDTHLYSFFIDCPFCGGGAWPTQIQYFRGPASGTPLVTVTKEYGGGLTTLLTRETLTWPTTSGTLSKKVEYFYGGF